MPFRHNLETILDRISMEESGCWQYSGKPNPLGYVRVEVLCQEWYTHRYIYTNLVGPIPENQELDHLCRNTSCCNPDHLEPVSHAVNCQRGNAALPKPKRTHCSKGHPFDNRNTKLVTKDGHTYQSCRTCCNESAREHQRRKAEFQGVAHPERRDGIRKVFTEGEQ